MRILRVPEVLETIGYKSRTSLYDQIKQGLFPKPISIGARAVGIPDDEVAAVLHHRINGASDTQIRALVVQLQERRLKALESLVLL